MFESTTDLDTARQVKHKAKLASGYASDSDDQAAHDSDDSNFSASDAEENEEEENAGKTNENADSKGAKSDDDDMFASDKEESGPELKHGKNNKKGDERNRNKLFNIDQFEQEQNIVGEDFDAGFDGTRFKKHAQKDIEEESDSPEVKIEAFNLREEAESGKFDKDMNFIGKNGSESDEEEPWMAEISSAEMKKARDAQEQISKAGNSNVVITKPIVEILRSLIGELEPAETPLEALARLRPVKRKGNKREKACDDPDRKKAVFEITDCCEQLVNEKGVSSAYDLSREELMRAYFQETGEEFSARGAKRKAAEMEASANDYGETIWQFRWAGDHEIHGPYSSYEMGHWKNTYFENRVEVRRVNELEFRPVEEVAFSDAETDS